MRKLVSASGIVVMIGAMAGAAAEAQIVAPPAPPPPPIIVAPPAPAGQQTLIDWAAGPVRCAGGNVQPRQLRMPIPGFGWSWQKAAERTLHFRISDQGRALSIRQDAPPTVQYGTPDDLAPSLAASVFAEGQPREDCSVTYQPRAKPLTQASPDDLMRLMMGFEQPAQAAGVINQLYPEGSDCRDEPRPMPLRAAYPDTERMAKTPGQAEWVLMGFGMDADGAVVDTRALASSHHAVLEKEALEAVGQTRFNTGPRKGCVIPFAIRPDVIGPVPVPDKASLRPKDANCPDQVGWARRPVMTYPGNWRRRSIEGVAVVLFDLAPWGAAGNLRVAFSEPGADFGEAAKRIVGAASAPASPSGYSGCVQVVRFALPQRGQPNVTE